MDFTFHPKFLFILRGFNLKFKIRMLKIELP